MAAITFEDFSRQGEGIRKIREQIAGKRLVHAILISGEPGTGKRTLAHLISSALMCKAENGAPCGKCAGCRMALSGEHPDITVIQKGNPISPDIPKGRATIPVDDIREMIRCCSQYAFENGNRSVEILDAENMTVQAQNCLLKILEEPPANTYFVLTASHPEQLLPTVRSRCRTVKLTPWEPAYIQEVLMKSGISAEKSAIAVSVSYGSIGNAFRVASDDAYWQLREEVMKAFFRNRKRSDVLNISSGWKDRKGDAEKLFAILEEHLRRLLVFRISPEGTCDIKDFPPEWQKFAAGASPDRFMFLADRIRDARKQNSFNVNFQAIIEQLILTFTGESDLWVK